MTSVSSVGHGAREQSDAGADAAAAEVRADVRSHRADAPQYASSHAMYTHEGGGVLYCGEERAARDGEALKAKNVKLIVNCQGTYSENFFEDDGFFTYHRHPMFSAPHFNSHAAVVEWFAPTHEKIEGALARGDSVLVHCMAGAHRAATMTASYLLYKRHQPLSNMQTYMSVTQQRAVVDLNAFSSLFNLLVSLHAHFEELDSSADGTQEAAAPTDGGASDTGGAQGAASDAANAAATSTSTGDDGAAE